MRCRGGVDVFSAGGRLQLVVREIDPLASLGMLERRRREILAGLEASGLLDRNRGLELPALPLRIGLVTSAGSAAYHDFMSSLRGERLRLRGGAGGDPGAGRRAPSCAWRRRSQALRASRVACAVLVRGGGSKSDLQIFESRAVAEAIARAPFPVLTGLGHEIDRSIADRVAHTSFKTPTMVAEFLVARLAAAEARVRDLERALARCARLPVARAELLAAPRRAAAGCARASASATARAGSNRCAAAPAPRRGCGCAPPSARRVTPRRG